MGARRRLVSRSASSGGSVGFDAVGFGQAMVDYAGYVSDEFLQDVLGELNKENNSGDKHEHTSMKKNIGQPIRNTTIGEQ